MYSKKLSHITLSIILLFILHIGCSSEKSKTVSDKIQKPAQSNSETVQLLLEAKQMFNNNDIDSAIKICKQVNKIDKNEKEAYYCLGNAFARQGNPREAIKYFSTFITFAPNSTEAYYNIATSYGILQEYENAVINFKKAIDINQNFTQSHFGLGLTYVKMGKKDLAKEVYEHLKTTDASLAERLYKLI